MTDKTRRGEKEVFCTRVEKQARERERERKEYGRQTKESKNYFSVLDKGRLDSIFIISRARKENKRRFNSIVFRVHFFVLSLSVPFWPAPFTFLLRRGMITLGILRNVEVTQVSMLYRFRVPSQIRKSLHGNAFLYVCRKSLLSSLSI